MFHVGKDILINSFQQNLACLLDLEQAEQHVVLGATAILIYEFAYFGGELILFLYEANGIGRNAFFAPNKTHAFGGRGFDGDIVNGTTYHIG